MLKRFSNPLSLSGGIQPINDEPQELPPPMPVDVKEDTLSPTGRRKYREGHNHSEDACCVGRCIYNDELPSWDTECEDVTTEEISLEGFEGIPAGTLLYLCAKHGPQFR